MMRAAIFAAVLSMLVPAVSVAARVPLPDSAVGNHRPVKPVRKGNWVVVRVQGHPGWWHCYIPANYKWPAPVRCKRASAGPT